ncbi:integrase, catalytic region, zinc finger, CCHC-type containing protein [Tanacetum coccineum]
MVVNDSVTSELARYKELVREYEKRAKFELTDRERKIDEQMRIIISDRNRKETSLKSELHSAQILLSSTVDHYKSKTEEVTLLKKDFKQKEDKFLEEFLDLKKLKDKIEDRLYKQDQSVQTVHMLCKPKSFYDEKHKVAIGYKNPLCLARAKQAQSALYNGHVLVTTNHTPTVIHDSEDTRELAEITRNRMLLKMQSPLADRGKPKGKTVLITFVLDQAGLWKATGKLFADIGYQWRPTGKKLTLGKLDCGSQWRPTGKKFALGEMCHLTKLSVKCCSKHMTGNRSKLMNFVEKFIGSVRFGNDHLGAIMGYGDYVMGDSVISRVYYVEGLGHNLFSVGQFCDSDLEVAFRKHTCFVRDIKGTDILKDLVRGLPRLKFEKDHLAQPETWKSKKVGLNKTVRFIRTDNGTEFVNQVMSEYYEGVGIFHQKSVPRTPQQNGIVERRNRTLVEAARTMMIFSKAPMFLWAEAVATACYTQNRSLIHTRHNKTSYELVHDKKPDLTFF